MSFSTSRVGVIIPNVAFGVAAASTLYAIKKSNKKVAIICSVISLSSFAYSTYSGLKLMGQNSSLNGQVATHQVRTSVQNNLINIQAQLILNQVEQNRILVLDEFEKLQTGKLVPAGDPAIKNATQLQESSNQEEKKQLTLELRGHIQRLNQSVYNRTRVQIAEIVKNPETRAMFHEHIPEAIERRIGELEVENTHLREEGKECRQKSDADLEDLKKLCNSAIQKNETLACELNELKQSQKTPANQTLEEVQKELRPPINYDLPQVRQAAMNIALRDEPIMQKRTSEKSLV